MTVGENVPESKGFVACTGYDRATVWTHGQVEHAVCVAGQGGGLLHLGVLPDVDFVVGVTVSAHQLVQTFAKHQVAHLRSDVHRLNSRASEGVSELDGAVGSASSRDQ
jgi:hypothetical protein